jgi:hypothetical protein
MRVPQLTWLLLQANGTLHHHHEQTICKPQRRPMWYLH